MNTHKDTENSGQGVPSVVSFIGWCLVCVNPVSAKCGVTPECPAGVQGLLAFSFVLLENMRAVEKKCFVSLGSLMGVRTKKKLYQSVAGPLGEELQHFVGRAKE